MAMNIAISGAVGALNIASDLGVPGTSSATSVLSAIRSACNQVQVNKVSSGLSELMVVCSWSQSQLQKACRALSDKAATLHDTIMAHTSGVLQDEQLRDLFDEFEL